MSAEQAELNAALEVKPAARGGKRGSQRLLGAASAAVPERVEIPMNAAGLRAFEMFRQIALQQLHAAREAAQAAAAALFPGAEFEDGNAVSGGEVQGVLYPAGRRAAGHNV